MPTEIIPAVASHTSLRPVLIAGPCSAETEAQVLETAKGCREAGADYFRAGIWKPRTHPGGFEGIGSKGLVWLQRAREEYGLKLATEVANAGHVEEVLRHGIDLIWIGARTTSNPFAVQEIARALEGSDIPVLVKNPIVPNAELWAGAIERFAAAGLKRIGIIHRGFSTAGETVYRNSPDWKIPIDISGRFPGITIIGDPSHMAGNAEYVEELSQRALDLRYDGLMIEVHSHPQEALSDGPQQITPQRLMSMLSHLVVRRRESDCESAMDLERLRCEIDECDSKLLEILQRRMSISEEIGKFKKQNNLTIYQSSRWKKLLGMRIKEGLSKGLGSDFISELFSAIHQESINHQIRIMKNDEPEN